MTTATSESIATQVQVFVGGSQLQAELSNLLIEVVVEQHALLPGMFTIALAVPRENVANILNSGDLDLTKEVEIKVKDKDRTLHSLIKGEITSVEPRFLPGMKIEMVVSGYDKSHRLYRETKSVAYLNKKDSDLASDFAGNAGLSAQVDSTSKVYDVIYQDNQSDLAFLMERAWRIGYECFVAEGKLYFRKPPTSGSGTKLKYGEYLQEFHPRLSLAEQVDEVQVKGWDWKKQEAIVGKATSGKLYAQTGESKQGAAWASSFGAGKKIFVDHPVSSQAEANTIATARLNEYSSVFETATGIAIRSPQIKAGSFVELEGLADRFNGKYMVTSCLHRYNVSSFETEFSVRGNRSGLLFEEMSHPPPVNKWGGVVPAIVTNHDDPEKVGRVKVKFPWMADDAESDWARVVCPGAGEEAGFYLIPQVGDEVIVAFEHGDINRPYVLGAVWNGKLAPPGSGIGAPNGEKHKIRAWTSHSGHEIAVYDTSADARIEILTSEGHNIVLSDVDKKIELKTSGGHSIVLDDMAKKVEVKDSTGNKIAMEASGVTMESTSMLNLKGKMVDIDGSGVVNIKGGVVNIN